MYTLVMAMLMVNGGKFGTMFGRKRVFMIGCVVYGLGSLTTARRKPSDLDPGLVVFRTPRPTWAPLWVQRWPGRS
jgi:hypothetical protein